MRNRSSGFTLLEVLVALAVLAIALAAGSRALGASARAAGQLRERTLAGWIAEDRFAMMRADNEFPPLGESDGAVSQAGADFRWHRTVKTTPNNLFRRVDVQVFAADGTPLATLSGFAVSPLR